MTENIAQTRKIGLSGSTLKIIAIAVMFVDHFAASIWYRLPALGYLQGGEAEYAAWWSSYMVMRQIGRTAFPIFCFLLVEGLFHTKNRVKYALRLFVFALVAEAPFRLAFAGTGVEGASVMATLFIGYMAIWGMEAAKERINKRFADPAARAVDNRPASVESVKRQLALNLLHVAAWVPIAVAACYVAYWLDTDYDYRGIMLIMILYMLREMRPLALIIGYISFIWEAYCLPGFVLCWFYNGKRGLKLKYFFYIFYPAHLFLFYLIWRFLL
ncbi:MAG: conjugal transfer protein TraX [Lachnospiraceae bacterium]|jgi:hypothetical protein|nr:conjugal transfer protein TraX [Lachnospiraceae bacterium]